MPLCLRHPREITHNRTLCLLDWGHARVGVNIRDFPPKSGSTANTILSLVTVRVRAPQHALCHGYET